MLSPESPTRIHPKRTPLGDVSLYQTHLPKLDNLDVVAYEPDLATLSAGLSIELVLASLSRVCRQQDWVVFQRIFN